MGLWGSIKEFLELSSREASRKADVGPRRPPALRFEVSWDRSPEEFEAARLQGIEDSVYLHSTRWDELLVPDENGLPPLRFQEHNGRLWFREDTTGKLVKVANRKLPRLGIWSVQVRGGSYRPAAVAATRIRIFEPVRLVREPENEFDKNAVAVHTNGGHVGYYNKQMAARLATILDRGDALEAVITSRDTPINVVAASPEIMAHLRRKT